MAKPTTSGKDYGHRTYMGKGGYTQSIRRPSDKQLDNRVKRPHSDDKKPYYEDEYPEMEHYWTPYDPPNLVFPPGIVDDPRIPPQRPDNPSSGMDDDEKLPGGAFTGCVFTVPAGPTTIHNGETTWHGIGVTRSDPLVSIGVNYGPVVVLSDYRDINTCVDRLTPNCIMSAQALETFDEEDYPHKVGDYFVAQIVATTKSGEHCEWDLLVLNCPPEVALEWDDDNSPETINQDESVTVYILGGSAPFEWSVSGTGFTMGQSKTNSRNNTLIADGSACGAAIITVTDGCDDSIQGSVRNTTGTWDLKETECGLVASGNWDIDCIGGILEASWPVDLTVMVGYQKQHQGETMGINSQAQGTAGTEAECEANRAAYDYGVWSTPCLPYPSVWTLTKPPGDCSDPTVRWQGNYEEFGGFWTSKPCTQSGPNWIFLRAGHTQVSTDYWEWECS